MNKKTDIEITAEGPVTLVAFKAASISDTEGIAAISRMIRQFIEENHPKRIIVDFEGVKFFSSQVLAVLLDIRTKLKAYDGKVAISAINPQLYRIFRITNLDKVFKFFPDRKIAVKEMITD